MAKRINKYRKSGAFSITGPSSMPKTNLGFEHQVKAQAKQSYQPQLSAVDQQIGQANSAHTGRVADINNWGQWYQGTLNDAYTQANAAMDKLIAQRTGASGAAQGALSSALRSDTASQNSLASMLGASPVQSPDEAKTLGAAYGIGEAGANELSTVGANGILAAANRKSLAPIETESLNKAESGRDFAAQQGLQQQRQSIVSQIPSFEEASRNDLLKQYLAQQSEGAQESATRSQLRETKRSNQANENISSSKNAFDNWLARSTLDLDTQKFAHQKAIDWGQLAVSQQNADTAAAQNGTGSLDAKAWSNGIDSMAAFLLPTKGETDSKGNVRPTYKRDPMALFRILTGQDQLDRTTALNIMLAANDAGISQWAGTRLPGIQSRAERHKKAQSIVKNVSKIPSLRKSP